jgi:predicted N-acetyltransferase YhbS
MSHPPKLAPRTHEDQPSDVSVETSCQLGFARAVSDSVNDAFLADVSVDPRARGRGAGKLLVHAMIEDGPGAEFRWTLFTGDARGLYGQFSFSAPDATAMVRPSKWPNSLAAVSSAQLQPSAPTNRHQ